MIIKTKLEGDLMMVWYICPMCHKSKIAKIDDSKHIEGVFFKCKLCKQEIEVKNK